MITRWRNVENGLPKENKEVLCWVEEDPDDEYDEPKTYGVVLYRYRGAWHEAVTGKVLADDIVKKWYAFTRPQAKKAKVSK